MTAETGATLGNHGGPLRPRPDIEGLRALAILFVVGFHAGVPGFTGGYVGVDVFFVLSGYLITWLLLTEFESTNRISFVRFYARRARRLFPALALMLVTTMIAAIIIYSPIEQRNTAFTAGATNLYVSNFFFAFNSMDYHGPNAQANPLLHTWSLAVEEQFYLIWPLLVLLALRTGSAQLRRRRLTLVMVALAVISFALSIWLTRIRQPWAFYSSPTRAWEFAIGGLTILTGQVTRSQRFRWAGWLGLPLLLAAVIIFTTQTPFPGITALLPVVGTALLLWSGGVDDAAGVSKLLGMQWLQKIGRLSYSWYLWHWPVLIFVQAVKSDLGVAGKSACVIAALIPAYLSFRLVEDPIRRHRVLKWRPVYSVAAAIALCLIATSVAVAWQRLATRAASTPLQLRLNAAHNDWPRSFYDDCLSTFYARGLNQCSFNNPDAQNTMVLFGDSHAAQWFTALDAVSKQEKWKLITFIKSACPVANVDFFYPAIGRRYDECSEWRGQVLQKIKELRPQLIVLTSADGYVKHSMIDALAWSNGLRRTFQDLHDSADRIVYLRDTPEPGFDVPSCLSRAVWHGDASGIQRCSVPRAAALDDNVYRLEKDAANGFSKVSFLDLTHLICPDPACRPEMNGMVIYRDSNHLTQSFVDSLAEVIGTQLRAPADQSTESVSQSGTINPKSPKDNK